VSNIQKMCSKNIPIRNLTVTDDYPSNTITIADSYDQINLLIKTTLFENQTRNFLYQSRLFAIPFDAMSLSYITSLGK
jgi:hypothetical protein